MAVLGLLRPPRLSEGIPTLIQAGQCHSGQFVKVWTGASFGPSSYVPAPATFENGLLGRCLEHCCPPGAAPRRAYRRRANPSWAGWSVAAPESFW
eukprot:COSAG06_NODE_6070_length_3127_cov_3.411823_5_plen_95_part_00